jgi:predicted dehydrogenase
MNRRHFYLGATAALASTRVWGANERVQMGIIGLGGRGTAHLGSYLKIPGAQVVALCDVNQAALEKSNATVTRDGANPKAKEYRDMRELLADKSVDAVSTATPNHWHALTTIWACQAGKDVYCEKPATHNLYEGWRVVDVARKTGRMVQIGSQSRTTAYKMRAVQLLHEGVIGKLYLAKGLCYKRRKSIGKTPETPVPPGVDWKLFLGPAPERAFTMNRFRYNWHWFWDTGNGDIGNQGVHEMDIALWGLGVKTFPKAVVSTGGKYVYDDDQETPNTQLASYTFDNGVEVQFEVRGLMTGGEGPVGVGRPNSAIGHMFSGSEGWMWLGNDGFQVFKGEQNEKVMDEKAERGDTTKVHMENFLQAVKSRKHQDLTADIEIGALAAAYCHLANISYRVGRRLDWDAAKKQFAGSPEANKLISREYRKPYAV